VSLSSFLKYLYFFELFLRRLTFPVFCFSSPASNRTTFLQILSPSLGLEPDITLLSGFGSVLGVVVGLPHQGTYKNCFPILFLLVLVPEQVVLEAKLLRRRSA
jgi:hypothetical protein